MLTIRKIKLWHKILVGIVSLILVSLSTVFIFIYLHLKENVEYDTSEKLIAINNLKKEQIETYYNGLEKLTELMGTWNHLVETYKFGNAAYSELKNNLTHHSYPTFKKIRDSIWNDRYIRMSKIIPKKKSDTMLPNNAESLILQVYSWMPKKTVGFPGLSAYKKIDTGFGVRLKNFAQRIGFYDIMFVDAKTGSLVYTVQKESDFGSNVFDSCYNHSGIRKAFQEVRYSSVPSSYIQDFEAYAPSQYRQASFISAPILDHGKTIGVIICQIDYSELDRICTFSKKWRNQGLGETGEVYLIGPDYSMRSESRFLFENKRELLKQLTGQGYSNSDLNYINNYNTSINTIKLKSNLIKLSKGSSRQATFGVDYRGKTSFQVYSKLNIHHLNWGLVTKMDHDEAYAELYALRNFLILLFIFILGIGAFLAYILSKRITNPIMSLAHHARAISEGDFRHQITLNRNDEIGELANSFQIMKSKIVELIQDLTLSNNDLEIKRRDILDSINYAQKIQENIFPDRDMVNRYIPESFLFFQPRDIVSGDFFWALEHEGELFLAVCDSTGHGIPGAFMSMLNVSFLNEAVLYERLKNPDEILNRVRNLLIDVFKNERQDGMDGILIRYNPHKNKLTYSAANNPIVLVRNGEYQVLEYDKMPIGNSPKSGPFRKFELDLQAGDNIYLITDGFADQFGGEKNKKYKYKPLFEFFQQVSSLSADMQRLALIEEFSIWQQHNEQVDDVTILGIKF